MNLKERDYNGFKWKTIDRTVIYNGKIVDVEIHTVTLPNGETSTRELVYHNGAVAVCAVTPKKRSRISETVS